jgi:undecaprenyl-phosphate 4-deoxy-4-formamido-L-arabinose transferase
MTGFRTMDKKYLVSVVIPVYQGQNTLIELADRLDAALPKFCEKFEVLFINDGSQDQSWNVICQIVEKYAWAKGIKLMRNYGQDNATLCGIRAAQYPITITMDDDLQHPPEELSKLVSKLDEGYDVVFGVSQNVHENFFRYLVTVLTKKILASIIHSKTLREISALRAFKTHLREASSHFNSPSVNLDFLLSWGTTKFTSTPINIEKRKTGTSNYTLSKLVTTTLLILTTFSTAPLRLASIIGFFMTLLGLAIFIYVIVITLTQGSVPGFPFLASIIALFGGAQLFTLGIFGEYLGHVFNRSTDRPSYVIDVERDQKK